MNPYKRILCNHYKWCLKRHLEKCKEVSLGGKISRFFLNKGKGSKFRKNFLPFNDCKIQLFPSLVVGTWPMRHPWLWIKIFAAFFLFLEIRLDTSISIPHWFFCLFVFGLLCYFVSFKLEQPPETQLCKDET